MPRAVSARQHRLRRLPPDRRGHGSASPAQCSSGKTMAATPRSLCCLYCAASKPRGYGDPVSASSCRPARKTAPRPGTFEVRRSTGCAACSSCSAAAASVDFAFLYASDARRCGTTCGVPYVSVPVLSKATFLTLLKASSASPAQKPAAVAFPIAAMIAVGVASTARRARNHDEDRDGADDLAADRPIGAAAVRGDRDDHSWRSAGNDLRLASPTGRLDRWIDMPPTRVASISNARRTG